MAYDFAAIFNAQLERMLKNDPMHFSHDYLVWAYTQDDLNEEGYFLVQLAWACQALRAGGTVDVSPSGITCRFEGGETITLPKGEGFDGYMELVLADAGERLH